MNSSVDALLRAQWTTLRHWMESDAVTAGYQRPSALDGWSIAELIAHTAQGFVATEACVDDATAEPQSFYGYISHYPSAAGQIADLTRQLSLTIQADLLHGIDEHAERGFAHLDTLAARVVRGLRGPILRHDFVLTRLLELVVHADDLARSVPEIPPPELMDEAVDVVATALAEAYEETVGHPPSGSRDLTWIRQAAGRVPSNDPALPLL